MVRGQAGVPVSACASDRNGTRRRASLKRLQMVPSSFLWWHHWSEVCRWPHTLTKSIDIPLDQWSSQKVKDLRIFRNIQTGSTKSTLWLATSCQPTLFTLFGYFHWSSNHFWKGKLSLRVTEIAMAAVSNAFLHPGSKVFILIGARLVTFTHPSTRVRSTINILYQDKRITFCSLV